MRAIGAFLSVIVTQTFALRFELKKHKTYRSWVDESFEYASAFAYLDGNLEHAKYHEHITASEVPDLNSNY